MVLETILLEHLSYLYQCVVYTGTKRVRQPEREWARASTARVEEPPDLQRERARAFPRADARPLAVVLS